MREIELVMEFMDFLVSKGYPKSSLMLEAPLMSSGENRMRYIVDLLILDTEYNNYIALVEFKASNKKSVVSQAELQVKDYLNAIGNINLPAYLITPGEDEKFIIYILSNNGWEKISLSDFPDYPTFQSKSQADIKNKFQSLEQETNNLSKRRKAIIISSAQSALISLIAGIAFIITAYNFNFKGIISSPDNNQQDEIILLRSQIIRLQNTFRKSQNTDSTTSKNNQIQKINNLDSRLISIEKTVSSSPDKLLKLQEIDFRLKELATSIEKEKEINDVKINSIKDKLDQVILWTSGLIITIIGSIAGFAINAFRKN